MFNVATAKVLHKIGTAPAKFLLFAAGWNEMATDEGEPSRYLVDRQAFDSVRADIARRGIDTVIDFEHQTLSGKKAPAAGWIRGANALTYEDGVGITVAVDWTSEAAGLIERAEYRYFSPVFAVRKADQRLVTLYSVALTNSPKHNHLKPILAKLGSQFKETKEENMNFFKMLFEKLGLKDGTDEVQTLAAIDAVIAKAKTVDKPAVAKEISEALGLAAGADVSNAVASIYAMKQKSKAKKPDQPVVAEAILEALGLDAGSDISNVVASVYAMKQNGKAAVDARVAALETKIAERDADDAVSAAMNIGKITPDQKNWAIAYAKKDLAGFNMFISKATVVVPFDKLPGKKKKADVAMIDETTLAVAKMFGNTADDLKKYGGLSA